MKVLRKPEIIYLCGGINSLSDAECTDWREATKARLDSKYAFLDPMRRDYRGIEAEATKDIVHGDLYDINASDILLVNASRPSWGTAMETFYAHRNHKTVITVCPSDKPSPWLVYHSDYIFKTFDEAFELLEAWTV